MHVTTGAAPGEKDRVYFMIQRDSQTDKSVMDVASAINANNHT